jgi:hypothetical protein
MNTQENSQDDSRENDKKGETNVSEESTFTYTKRTTNIELEDDWYSINDTCKILQLSQVWVRRQIKQRKFEKTKKVDGKWWISRESILEKLEYLEEKDERLERRLRGESTSNYVVPSLKSCSIIRRRVKLDETLNEEQRELFLERIDSYEEFFTQRLSKIREERK